MRNTYASPAVEPAAREGTGVGEMWKIRSVKTYPDAHNHVLIGRVLARDAQCVTLRCRSFHYGRMVNHLKDIAVGPVETRMIPWARVEIINVLPDTFDVEAAAPRLDADGSVLIEDGRHGCTLAAARNKGF